MSCHCRVLKGGAQSFNIRRSFLNRQNGDLENVTEERQLELKRAFGTYLH
jgi:hypothetical protein